MLIEIVKSRKAKALAGALRCPPVGAKHPDVARGLLVRQRSRSKLRGCCRTFARAQAPSSTGAARCDRRCARATSVSDGTGFACNCRFETESAFKRESAQVFETSNNKRRSPTPRSPAPAGVPLRRAPGAGSVLFDPEAGVVTGLTRDRDSRSENRCSMCSAIHISSRTSLRPSSTREPSDPPPRVVLTFVR